MTHSEQQAEKIKEAMNSGLLNKDVGRDNPTLSTSTKPNTEGTQAVPRSLDGIKTEGVAKVEGAVTAEGELKGTAEKSLTTNPTSVTTPTKVDADIKTSVQGNGAAGAVNLNFAETKQQQFNNTSSNAATVNQRMN